MSPSDRLRQEAADLLLEAERRAGRLIALADELDSAAPPLADARDELITLKDSARILGESYDTVRMRPRAKGRS